MAQHIQRALASESYDLIFMFSSSMAQYAQTAQETLRIVDLVDVDSDKWRQYAKRTRGPRSWLWRYEARHLASYEAKIVESFSATLVCTHAESQVLRLIAPVGKIDVLENVVDVAYFDPQAVAAGPEILSWQPYIIFTGWMDYFPNIDAVQYFYREIFPQVRRELPRVQFVVAGRNPPPSIARLAADAAVRVTGSVPDIRPYLRAASLAVAPMRIARGVQNKILEAMAMGIPVATTSAAASALPKSLASLLVVEDDPKQFGAALLRLLRQRSNPPCEEIRKAVCRHFASRDLKSEFRRLLFARVAKKSVSADIQEILSGTQVGEEQSTARADVSLGL